MAGLWCANVGYGRPELAECMKEQTLKLSYYHSFISMGTDAPAILVREAHQDGAGQDVEGVLRQ